MKGAFGSPRCATVDHVRGYPVYRAQKVEAAQDEVVADFAPDAVIIEGSFPVPRLETALAARQRVVAFLRNCEWQRLGGDLPRHVNVRYAANSQATAAAHGDRFGVDAVVIPPLVDPALYRCEPQARYVTFVNPVPEKGVDLAFAIAELCPEIEFQFIESWPRPPAEREWLKSAIDALPNVRLLPPSSDMRDIYRRTAFMLVPSQWFEGWGRIVTEAQISGIPSIASNMGGLPEAVGKGGILLPANAPAEAWAAACRQMWSDEQLYADFSKHARAHSQQNDPGRLAVRLEKLVEELVNSR
ncbi:MAG: glycosyltransferase [Pacificimonas sp.]